MKKRKREREHFAAEKIENYIFAFQAYLKVEFSVSESIFCDKNPAQANTIQTIFPITHIKDCTIRIYRHIAWVSPHSIK